MIVSTLRFIMILILIHSLNFNLYATTVEQYKTMIREAYASDIQSGDVSTIYPIEGGSSVPPLQTTTIFEYIPHDNNYNHVISRNTDDGFDSTWANRSEEDAIDQSYDGRSVLQRCNKMSEYHSCDIGGHKFDTVNNLTLLNTCTEHTYGPSNDEEYTIKRWSDFPNYCYVKADCTITGQTFKNIPDQNNTSPKQACLNAGGSNCNNKSDQCLYKSDCLYSYDSDEYYSGNLFKYMICEDDYNCQSGFCNEVTSGSQTIKVCAPFARCTPKCKEEGEYVSEEDGEWCCVGYKLNKNETCYDPDAEIPGVPEEINYDINDYNCETYLYEEDNKDDKTTALKKFWSYNRLMYGLAWTWGKANNNQGKDDFFYTNKLALETGKEMLAELNKLENIQAEKTQFLQDTLDELKGKNNEEGNQTTTTISTAQLFAVMAEDFSNKSTFDAQLSVYYNNTSLKLNTLLQKVKSPSDHGPPKNDDSKLAKLKYNYYSQHKYSWHWPWDGDEWYKAASSSVCDVLWQKNQYCVKELWHTEGHMSGKQFIVDPLYPKSILNNIQSTSQDNSMSDGEIAGNIALTILLSPHMIATGGLLALPILPELWGGHWDIPKVVTHFNNKRESLVKAIHTEYTKYADKNLTSDDANQNEKNKTKDIKQVNLSLDPAEIKIKLDEAYPSNQINKEERKTLNETIRKSDPHFRRTLLLEIISSMIASNISLYGGTDSQTRSTSDRESSIIMFKDISDYLSRFLLTSSEMYAARAACLSKKGQDINDAYLESSGGSSLSTSLTSSDKEVTGVSEVTNGENPDSNCSSDKCNDSQGKLIGNSFSLNNSSQDGHTSNLGNSIDQGNEKNSNSEIDISTLKNDLAAQNKAKAEIRKELLQLRGVTDDGLTSSNKLKSFFDQLDGPKAFANRFNNLASTLGLMESSISAPTDTIIPQEKKKEDTIVVEKNENIKPTPIKKDASNVQFFKGLSTKKKSKKIKKQNISSSEVLKKYKINNEDINKNDSASIWNIITIRYLKTGVRRLFEE